MLTVGDHEMSFDDALSRAVGYARAHAATVLYFDFAGKAEGEVTPSNGVTLADLGRMTLINADLNGGDAAKLLATKIAWPSVPSWARLEDADPDEPDGLYFSMNTMWKDITVHKGIGPSKASKLLHIKRPFAFPILDRDVRKTYKARSRNSGSYWRSIREDLIKGSTELERLGASLGEVEEEAVKRASRLPALRLLDLIAWEIQQQ